MQNHGLDKKQTQALNHPLRLRILEMSKRERDRSLSVESLTDTLAATREFEHVNADEVFYHRNCLMDAELLPK